MTEVPVGQCICSHLERDHAQGGACSSCGCLIFDEWAGPTQELAPIEVEEVAEEAPREERREWWEDR